MRAIERQLSGSLFTPPARVGGTLSETIWFAIQFFVGLLLGIALNSMIIYPLLYGLPRSIAWYSRDRINFKGVLFNLIAPLFIGGLMVVVGFISTMWLPSVVGFVASPGFIIGEIASVIALLLNILKKGNDDEFRKAMVPFEKGNDRLNRDI